MKNYLIAGIIITAVLTSCTKTGEVNRNLNVPVQDPQGKWVSVAYYNGSGWVADPMPHHFEFKVDRSFFSGTTMEQSVRGNIASVLRAIPLP